MMNQLEDWGHIAFVCPCQTKTLETIENIQDFKEKAMKMDSSPRQINFICEKCDNSFDYDVKIRLFELLNEHIEKNGACQGFIKYISRKGQKIRLRFIKELSQKKTNKEHKIIVIEAANLTTHPQFKT